MIMVFGKPMEIADKGAVFEKQLPRQIIKSHRVVEGLACVRRIKSHAEAIERIFEAEELGLNTRSLPICFLAPRSPRN